MRVVTVYKSGGDFDIRYVIAIHNALKMYMPCTYEFVVLTDKPNEVKPFATPILLTHDLPKWWSKIELFNPNHFYNKDGEMNLYFDLDVVILKNISLLLQICNDCVYSLMLRSSDVVGKENDWPSSSIMSWKGSAMNIIYERFFELGAIKVLDDATKNISRAGQQTDQGFIRQHLGTISKFQSFLSSNYIIFKYPDYYQNKKLMETATILNWTGKPRLHTMGKSFSDIYPIWKERTHILTNQE